MLHAFPKLMFVCAHTALSATAVCGARRNNRARLPVGLAERAFSAVRVVSWQARSQWFPPQLTCTVVKETVWSASVGADACGKV